MPTELAEPLVSAPTARIFFARRTGLRLVIVPRYSEFGQGGRKIGESAGMAIQFKDGRFILPLEGMVTLDQGRVFPVEKVAEALVNHHLNGNRDEGFWPVEQVAPPVSQEELQTILAAAMDLDLEKVQELVEQERAGWARESFLAAAEHAIERLEAMIAEAQARAVELAQQGPPAAAEPKPAKAAKAGA